jgi:hypothetical protein
MQWENITDYYYAWSIYAVGAIGCSLAAWLFFRGLPRALLHFFVVTIMVLLFTPFAIDSKSMILAPAIVCLGYGVVIDGFVSIKPVLKSLIAVWAVAMVISLVYQLLTRKWYKAKQAAKHESQVEIDQPHTPNRDQIPDEQHYRQERAEPIISDDKLVAGYNPGESPIHAER